MSDPAAELAREVDLFDRRVRGWTGRSWAVRVGAVRSRADVVAELAGALAGLCRVAGVPVPARAALPRVADHALPDQVIVLAADLLAVLEPPAASPTARRVATQAAEAIRSTRHLLA